MGFLNILVLCSAYPDKDNPTAVAFVHSRILNYQKAGLHRVWVLNFSARERYCFEGVEVLCPADYRALRDSLQNNTGKAPFSLMIAHAPNLRNHYLFLRRHAHDSRRLMFFFHGHEVLRLSQVYPRPYAYQKKSNRFLARMQDLYDSYKFWLWRRYYPRVAERSAFVFVSHWMQNEFFKWTRIGEEQLRGRCHVIYNSISPYFETAVFELGEKNVYDFISIRSLLDGSKYCVDLINQWAFSHPHKRFLLIGKGEYFQHNEKAANLDVEYRFIPQHELFAELSRAKCALMPTRLDAQGVMACEMATCGMPLISSDIPVCREVFADFPNVRLIPNRADASELGALADELCAAWPYPLRQKYSAAQTTDAEIRLIERLCGPNEAASGAAT